MADKLVPGDSLNEEVFDKFNGMADEVNELKESGTGGGSGGAVVELSGDNGTLTDDELSKCMLPTTALKVYNVNGIAIIYNQSKYLSPTIYFESVYVDETELGKRVIEIDVNTHRWRLTYTEYSGSGGSVVSVKQTLTSGTEIGSITVNGTETKLYAPEGSTDTTPAVINYVNALPTENIDTSAEYMVIDTVESWVGGVKNQMPDPSDYLPDMLSGIPITVNMVDTLPSTGEYATDDYNAPTKIVLYYQKSDMELYAYMPEGKVPTTGETNLGNTWQKANVFLIGAFYITYRGFISSGDESKAFQGHSNLYLFVSGERYRYKNGSWQNVEAGSGSNAIIDVDSLPSENINEKAFYRVTEFNVSTLFYGMVNMLDKPVTVHVVDTLPTAGESAVQGDLANPSSYVIYYQKSDNSCYSWAPAALGVPTDMWLPAENLLAMNGVSYGGVITSAEEAIDTTTFYVLVKISTKLYHYKDGWHEIGGGNSPQIITVSTLDEMGANLTKKTISVNIIGIITLTYGETTRYFACSYYLSVLYVNENFFELTGTSSYGPNIYTITFRKIGTTMETLGQLIEITDSGFTYHDDVVVKIDPISAIYITNEP